MTTRTPPEITALVLARDEAHNLAACLHALRWAWERVVVVDPASVDQTEAIARKHADRVLVRPFDTFAAQRNAGLDLAGGDWIFSVDADERSSPQQAAEVLARLARTDAQEVGYRVPIQSVILGRGFRFSGTQHDLPLRLFRRGLGRWRGAVHETVAIDGPIGRLDTPLAHHTLPTMESFLRKIDCYTTLEALQMARDGRPYRGLELAWRPWWTFAKLYLAKQGFRDGVEGLAFCALSGVSVAVRHWKHRELVRAGRCP